jgi:hypothetical protein
VDLQSLQLDVHEVHQDQQQEQQQQEGGSASQCIALWQPFLQFLQQCRQDVLQQLQQEQQQLLQLGTVASEIHTRFAGPAAAVQTSAPLADAASRRCSTVCGEANAAAAAVTLPCIGVGEECLPFWLVQQLPGYIPQDLSSIVVPPVGAAGAAREYDSSASATAAAASAGSAERDGMSGRLPVRLHGDLMSGNLVLQLQRTAAHAAITEQQLQSCETLHPEGSAALGIEQELLCDGVSPVAATGEPRRLQQLNCGEAAGMQTSHMEQQQPNAQQQGLQQVSFIDFADGGIGDPLYDLVAVFVSVLDCDMQLLQLALQSYASCIDVAAVWPSRLSASGSAPACSALDCSLAATADGCDSTEGAGSNRSSSRSNMGWQCCGASHAFMVYLLLHEEGGILGQLLEKQPQLRACCSLQEMQQQLFGWMDDWWASCVQHASAQKSV